MAATLDTTILYYFSSTFLLAFQKLVLCDIISLTINAYLDNFLYPKCSFAPSVFHIVLYSLVVISVMIYK